MAQQAGWCTIESDPGVFTELISKFGVKDVQVEEVIDLGDETYKSLGSVYGLIFLFKWEKDHAIDIEENVMSAEDIPDGLFFSKQMINNACATQAIINVLLNCSDKIELGQTLTDFKAFTQDLDPEMRGVSLENSEAIRVAHNSFARPDPIQIEHAKDDEEGEAFHFIAYVPNNGFVYEIDGLQKGPRLIDGCDGDDWYGKATDAIKERMAQYKGELRFTLLGLIKNQQTTYNEELTQLQGKQNGNANGMDIESKYDDMDENTRVARIAELQSKIESEKAKFARYKRENIRRRHNYFPFIFNFLQVLAEKNVLSDLTKRAQEKKKVKLEAAKKEADDRKAKEEEKKKDDEAAKKETKTATATPGGDTVVTTKKDK